MTEGEIIIACENACMRYPEEVAVVKVTTPYAVSLLSMENMRFAYCIPDATAKDVLIYVPSKEKICRELFAALAGGAHLIAKIESV